MGDTKGCSVTISDVSTGWSFASHLPDVHPSTVVSHPTEETPYPLFSAAVLEREYNGQ